METMSRNSDFVAMMDKQLKKWDADVDALAAQGEKASATARAAYQEMAIAAFNTGQFKQAYLFQSRFMALTDSIQNERKIEKALEEEFNFKEEKNKLEQEKKDLIYQNRVMKQQW